jgi:hypothetical protein
MQPSTAPCSSCARLKPSSRSLSCACGAATCHDRTRKRASKPGSVCACQSARRDHTCFHNDARELRCDIDVLRRCCTQACSPYFVKPGRARLRVGADDHVGVSHLQLAKRIRCSGLEPGWRGQPMVPWPLPARLWELVTERLSLNHQPLSCAAAHCGRCAHGRGETPSNNMKQPPSRSEVRCGQLSGPPTHTHTPHTQHHKIGSRVCVSRV